MKISIFIAICFAIGVVFSIPNFPPIEDYQINVTFSPVFYDNEDMSMTGVLHASPRSGKYAIEAKDTLRTFENDYFRLDTGKFYFVNKFGEFPADCQVVAAQNNTSIPPTFTQTYFQENAKSIGSQEGFDVYEINDGNVQSQFFFQNDMIAKIVSSDGTTKRQAEFSDFKATPQDPSYFEVPSGVSC